MRFLPSTFVVVLGIASAVAACSDSESSPETNPRAEAIAHATDNISCSVADDCCAVLDGCLAQFLIVSAADQVEVEQLLGSASQEECLACIPPMVQVDCLGGRCMPTTLESTDPYHDEVPVDFIKTHCGRLDVPAGWVEKAVPATSSEPASFQPKYVVGC